MGVGKYIKLSGDWRGNIPLKYIVGVTRKHLTSLAKKCLLFFLQYAVSFTKHSPFPHLPTEHKKVDENEGNTCSGLTIMRGEL